MITTSLNTSKQSLGSTLGESNKYVCERTGHRLLNNPLMRVMTCVFVSLMLLLSNSALSAVAGDILDTDAEVRYLFNGQTFSKTDNAPLVVANFNGNPGDGSGGVGTPAALDIWSPLGSSTTTASVTNSSCDTGSSVISNPTPTLINGSPIALPSSLNVTSTDQFKSGNPLVIRIIDLDQNQSNSLQDTIQVELSTAIQPFDREQLILTETTVNSGEFVGIIQTESLPAGGSASNNDCRLSLQASSELSILYQDENDNEDRIVRSLNIDPISRVFDALTGELKDGIEITLVDARTGLPATVYGDDGISIYPSTVISGENVSDASGKNYIIPDGSYRFPYVPLGDYRIEVAQQTTLAFPSEISDEIIQALPSGPYNLSGISRGSDFTALSHVFNADIPLDPKSDRILLEKTTTKSEAGVGDFIPFSIRVSNAESFASGIVLQDTLPTGLTFTENSLVINGSKATPTSISKDGRSLQFALPDLEASQSIVVEYVSQVSPNAKDLLTNEVIAIHPELKSNIAKASVNIRDDFYRSSSRLFGRIILDDCQGNLDAEGISGVRLYMEDGTYVVTDEQGEWHIEGVKPGTHVVQVDTESLPAYLEVIECDESFFHAGQSYSQFVDLQPGSLWRADFHVRVKEAKVGEVVQSLQNELVPLAAFVEDTTYNSPVNQKIKYALHIEGHTIALQDVREFIVLPKGVVLEPGSLTIDGIPSDEFDVQDNTILINFGDKPEHWRHDIEFFGIITDKAQKGDLTAKARLFYKSGLPNSQWTPDAETSALLFLPPANGKADPVTPPRFANFAEQLTEEDKLNLSDVIDKLDGLQDLKIAVVGHTDNIPIARHNRHIFEDNQALSEARAQSVAHYLSQQLNLPVEKIQIHGMGESAPIASNTTRDGRAQNRRVEVRVLNASASAAVASIEADIKIAKTEGLLGGLNAISATAADKLQGAAQLQPIDQKPNVDQSWFAAKKAELKWVWPADHYNPAISATDIIIQHPKNTRVRLTLNGVPVHAVYFDGMSRSKSGPVATSEWKGVEIEEGDNQFVAEILNRDEEVIDFLERNVHFAAAPANAEWLPDLSYTTADGISAPIIAIKFTDKDGYPVRPNSRGIVDVSSPYQLLQSTEYDNNPLVNNDKPIYQVEQDGIAFIKLQPTSQSGEVKMTFEYGSGLNDELRIWLEPEKRDWLLVGLGDLTLGANKVSGNENNLRQGSSQANSHDDLYQDGRVAFFAKGQIPGDFLLTAAYDSKKEKTTPFATLVQPGEFYTLYADASTQGNDASSGEKLYVKVEKERFYTLFGDLNTGLNKSQLGRYVRNLTGIQVVYLGDIFEASGFASESELGFVRDEIQGNGTSGLYQLSNKFIVANSETIVIETRDRLRSEIIVKREELTRHIDYSLDNQSGSLYFKSPIATTDSEFNPNYIVANYETEQPESGHIIGGRAGVKLLDDTVKTGITAIEESSSALDSQLNGVDAEVNIGNLKLTAEVAQTTRSATAADLSTAGFQNKDASAKRAEAIYRSGEMDIKAYAYRIDDEFGLAQQNQSELDKQKVGIETSFYVTDQNQIRLDTSHQKTISTGLDRQQAEAEWTHKLTNISSIKGGISTTVEETNDGPKFVDEMKLGGTWSVWDKKLKLNTQATTDISERSEENDRLKVGAEYRWNDDLSSFAEYERSFNQSNLERSTVGLRSQPWQGGQVEQSLNQETMDDGYRLYSVSGLSHDWQLDEHWLVSFGFNQSKNLASASPTETGSETGSNTVSSGLSNSEDFNAFSTGWAYRSNKWQWTNRLERRDGQSTDTLLAHTSLYHPLSDALATGGSLDYYKQDLQQGYNQNWNATFDLAIRPRKLPYAILLQTQWLQEAISNGGLPAQTRKLINNAHLNWRFSHKDQLASQYGIKRTLDQYNSADYASTTHYLAAEWRHQLNKSWDLGAHGRELIVMGADQQQNSYGLSVGYRPVKNLWTSLGYNFEGFVDNDFSAANYTSQGIYLKLRFKADQESLQSLRQAFNW